jgi:hypothetical protein
MSMNMKNHLLKRTVNKIKKPKLPCTFEKLSPTRFNTSMKKTNKS